MQPFSSTLCAQACCQHCREALLDVMTLHKAAWCAGEGVRFAAGEGPGVLEIKCPYNRGRPQEGTPPAQPPWYYMPQVRTLPLLLSLPAPNHAPHIHPPCIAS